MSPDDILLKKELDRLASSYPNFKVSIGVLLGLLNCHMGKVYAKHDIFAKFQVFYTVDKPSSDWRGGVGYISKDMVLKGLPGPGEDSLILVSSF